MRITNPIPQERDPKRSGNKMAQDNIRQRLQLAYDANAIDYCVKPIRQEKLEKALAKARRLTKAQIVALDLETNNTGRSHICARVRGNLE